MRCEITCYVSTDRAGCLCGAGCFAVIVRYKITGYVSTNGAGCLCSAGCFTVVVSVRLTVGSVTSGTNSLFGTGGFPTLAGTVFLMFCIVCANARVCTITVGCPATISVCIVYGNGQFVFCFYVTLFVEESAADRTFAVCLFTCCGAVCFNHCNQVAKRMGCCDLAISCFPFLKACDLIGASSFGKEVTARATVVVLPTVNGAGCSLTGNKFTVTVGVRDGSVIFAGVTDHIRLVIVFVVSNAVLQTAGTNLPVLFAVAGDPFAKGVNWCGNDQCARCCGILFAIEISLAFGATVVCFHTCSKIGGGMGCRNLGDRIAKAVCLELTVFCLTIATNCFLCAGCLAAITIGSFGVLNVSRTFVGVCSITIRDPRSIEMRVGIDCDSQLLLRSFNHTLVEITVTGRATIMRLHTGCYTGSIYTLNLFAKGVIFDCSVSTVTLFASCFLCAGCFAAAAITVFFVCFVVYADTGVGAVAVGYPTTPLVCFGVDGNDQFTFENDILFFVKIRVTDVAEVVCFHTCIFTGGIFLLKEIIVLVCDFANVVAIATSGVTVVIKAVTLMILCIAANLTLLPVFIIVVELFFT